MRAVLDTDGLPPMSLTYASVLATPVHNLPRGPWPSMSSQSGRMRIIDIKASAARPAFGVP